MYISNIWIQNFRIFENTTVDFFPGLNVIIGENNSGKTTVVRALATIFGRDVSRSLTVYDFFSGISNFDLPPRIKISVTLSSDANDSEADLALVASWLTKLEPEWKATLTFEFFLPETALSEFISSPKTNKKEFWSSVEIALPKYVSRIYAGNPEAKNRVETELLDKINLQLLEAIRDVENEMFRGSNPLFRRVVNSCLDIDLNGHERTGKAAEIKKRKKEFQEKSEILLNSFKDRLDSDAIFELTKKTGADAGGKPKIGGKIEEGDLISALRLKILRFDRELPATFNGLGYSNLTFISLILKSLELETSADLDENATIFPMLAIEEPEAHLHPALQYKLLKYLQERVRQEASNRQIFITTHSTQITAAVGLAPLIVFSVDDESQSVKIAYPGKVFGDSPSDKESKAYVERYLDATKSNMLFSKGVIFVEGLAEQILIPCLAEYNGTSLEDNYIAIIGVGGSTFKHFLPIFGAVEAKERQKYALNNVKVSLVLDADPCQKKKPSPGDKPRWKACYPFELGSNPAEFEYKAVSSVVDNLREKSKDAHNIGKPFHGKKTLEYDLGFQNFPNPVILQAMEEGKRNGLLGLGSFPAPSPTILPTGWSGEICDGIIERLNQVGFGNPSEKVKALFASLFLSEAEGGKGEFAFFLEKALRENLNPEKKASCFIFSVPQYIKEALNWVCRNAQ
jgi:putative ATP-dependent endonuclease of OLD family